MSQYNITQSIVGASTKTDCTSFISDVNECAIKNGGCNHNCMNTEGAYKCLCKEGYVLGSDGKTCTGNVMSNSFPYTSSITLRGNWSNHIFVYALLIHRSFHTCTYLQDVSILQYDQHSIKFQMFSVFSSIDWNILE